MLNCEDVILELNDYLDDTTAADLRRELESHLGHCRPCEVVVNSCRQTVKIVTASRSFDLPPGLAAKILAKVKAEKKG